ncbi:makorin, ring finger protein, 4 isoform X2 [Conger conger]|uniref:makorin, ring finger protein, 4 isoform X2 n=1 Tax=Conger conger TaxID=82655 RepID=UPI002A5A3886|nr:makorin, ring finger protein, 4 isoform X2 [Conger conger]
MEKGTNGISLDVDTGILCRQYIRGSCRFGPSCHFSHELPVLPSAEICRYFQKGACWFGDRCRYQHILQPDGSGPGSRWGSAPPTHPPGMGNRAILDRRGSEPSISQAHGAYSGGRRGSEPLVNGMVSLQHSFEHLSMGIAEEEEQAPAEAAVRRCQRQGSWSQLQHRGQNSSWRDFPQRCPRPAALGVRAGPAMVAEVVGQDSGAGKQSLGMTSGQQEAAQSGAAAPSGRDWPDEAYKQSKDVMCGICMDKVYEKPSAQERRFGILPNCSHAFCLGCIVTWRKTKDFQDEVIKACPQCRVKSSYYIPSKYWVSDGDQKQTLITAFKEKSSKIRCNFFMRHGCCPFKSECIYRHELPNGYRPRRRRSSPVPSTSSFEGLDSDSLQLLHYIIALALLDEDDVLEEDDYFRLYLDEDGDPL